MNSQKQGHQLDNTNQKVYSLRGKQTNRLHGIVTTTCIIFFFVEKLFLMVRAEYCKLCILIKENGHTKKNQYKVERKYYCIEGNFGEHQFVEWVLTMYWRIFNLGISTCVLLKKKKHFQDILHGDNKKKNYFPFFF